MVHPGSPRCRPRTPEAAATPKGLLELPLRQPGGAEALAAVDDARRRSLHSHGEDEEDGSAAAGATDVDVAVGVGGALGGGVGVGVGVGWAWAAASVVVAMEARVVVGFGGFVVGFTGSVSDSCGRADVGGSASADLVGIVREGSDSGWKRPRPPRRR